MEYSLVERSDKRMESSLPKQGKEVLRDRALVGGPGGGLSEEGFQSVLHNSNSTALSNQGGFHMSDMQGQGKEARLFTQGGLMGSRRRGLGVFLKIPGTNRKLSSNAAGWIPCSK